MLLRKNCLLYICAAAATLAACGRDKAARATSPAQGKTAVNTAALTTPTTVTSVNLAPSNPLFVAVDPYANVATSADGLKPARPFWYSVDAAGLTILRIDDNMVVYTLPWPQTVLVGMPNGEFERVPAPAVWEPVGMTVSYPTEEALASNSETPDTLIFVVMAHSGLEWQSNPNPPAGQDPGVRDTLAPATSAATESSMLLQIDVTDVMFSSASVPTPADAISAAILGHGAGQPAFDPSTGSIYIGNMPSMSLPTAPVDLTSFVSVITPLAPPIAEAAAPAAAPEAPMVVICGPEHPEDGLLLNAPIAWPCTESGDGPAAWEFQNLPPWLFAHADKLSGQLDGLLYGTPTAIGSWIFQARVIDFGEDPVGIASEWMSFTLNVTATAPNEGGDPGFEAGVPAAQPIEGTGSCAPAPTASPGSIVPAWIDVMAVPNGCVVMGTAPISGEYYEFALPGFHFPYPYDREPAIFSGNVMGTYAFDALPAGVGLSGLAWHQIEKIHDPSTEADILNVEFVGVEPLTGQLYRILPPQGVLEGSGGDVTGPPETRIEGDTITAEGTPLAETLAALRPDIAAAVNANPAWKVRFGDVAVEVDRDIYVSAPAIVDATGATVKSIGGPSGSIVPNGALLKVNAVTTSVVDLPGVQASFLGLDSDLRPAVIGVEPGQVDHGALWVTGSTTGTVAVVDTAAGTNGLLLDVTGATSLGGVSVNVGGDSTYVAGKSLQNVTIFGAGATPPPRAPWLWSPALATFSVGVNNSLTVLATGWPQPAVTCAGTLPQGLTFQDNGNGVGILSGIPPAGTGGDYALTFTATNSLGSTSQAFVLSIADAPLFTSPNTASFFVGAMGSFTLTTTGSPSVTTMWVISGTLPAGLSFVDNGDATGTIAGTAAAGTEGSYVITVTASTGVPPDAVQEVTVVVNPGVPTAPVITSASSATYQLGIEPTFIFTAVGFPTPALSQAGALPGGVSFTDNGDGSASLEGFPEAAGTYTLIITAANGVPPDATQSFNLIILPAAGTPPSITVQPLNQTVNAGQTATFTAAATGNPIPTVQWQRSTDGGVTFGNITGAMGNSYTTPSTTTVMNGYRFRAVFTNGAGSATTVGAILTVTGPTGTAPVVTVQPANQTVGAGQTATFTAGASGNPAPTVQWELSTDGASWSIIAGATSGSYTTPPTTTAMNGYRYRAVFTNSLGTAYSNTAALTVMTPPTVTLQPMNQTVTAGQTATFTAAASGNPTPTVQWQLSTDGTTWQNISGATASSYTTAVTTVEMNGHRYRAAFSNSAGTSYSIAATLSVNAVTPTLAVVTTSVPNGTVGQAYSYALQAQGGTAPYTWALGARRALPNGLRLSANGVISGSPTRAGTYAFVVVVTDGASSTAQQTLTMTIAPRR